MAQIAPVIELRGIKRTAWASEETHCYQATLYVDGEKWGTVSNQGHGGCDVAEGIAMPLDLAFRFFEGHPQ